MGHHCLVNQESRFKFVSVITVIRPALEIIKTWWHCGSAYEKTWLQSLLITVREKKGNNNIWLNEVGVLATVITLHLVTNMLRTKKGFT